MRDIRGCKDTGSWNLMPLSSVSNKIQIAELKLVFLPDACYIWNDLTGMAFADGKKPWQERLKCHPRDEGWNMISLN
jgi:hypothetical protein